MSSQAPQIRVRQTDTEQTLPDLHPVLSRVYQSRGIATPDDLNLQLAGLVPYHEMLGIDGAVSALMPVVTQGKRLLVVGDFDADGATSTAVALRALRMMGAPNLDYLVPNRFDFGYGLSPELVEVAIERRPDLIMTVDNGIASVSGVAAANAAGIPVVVTDHHLPGDELPEALAIVNPNQKGCAFPSKAACGCTVVFYLMLALRACLSEEGWFDRSGAGQPPNLASLIDLVALATVADVVPLDKNNRILVEQGLRRIRAGKCQPGILALLQTAKRDHRQLVSSDLGFAVGPRINAAGRLDDMSLGIECLLTDDFNRAMDIATELDAFNRDRRQIEQAMQGEALALLERMDANPADGYGVCLYHPEWHQGVIGILASRIKERLHRPVIAFARGEAGEIKGSARSITGLHIRDALDRVDRMAPGIIVKFGGHAMAAGLTLAEGTFERFSALFDDVCKAMLSEDALQQILETDGSLASADFNMALAEALRLGGPWGQAFPEPQFSGTFRLVQQRLVGGNHLKLVLQPEGTDQAIDAIWFGIDPSVWPDHSREKVTCVYQLDINEFRGERNLQLRVVHME
ncbi:MULTISPECIES: single-stranded-DNA-specific exonuclease RecJ [Thalassolituus]|uniref:single-stranded-DNA-specific exonuclease RecJ n=1 Tax=Thalassolituus TaxID=187492 RepID=UPI000C4C9581|nr:MULTISPECIES: single-stranded-DNA-specific exonuclease RecJ [Thalassolituus]MAX86850.1 single-stranded-DNA-specific exonuclease RecJ [Oceanospirillaceae bacterium]MEC8908206.1 single-stranded-DNA-specific exonuclease RecJ [Pseudomonadota bacterium]MEE2748326.1 single-stranded-DNA-specific exonuclease RecJ [Pseudomonadota bacterium]|tara:strand:- start:3813 stop:5540 length:1728 start_codon:yes stop_codon:yes gene_type:complete